MIEDAINRLAAAIEAQNAIQAENQRLFAELVAVGRPVTPAAAVVVEHAPEPKVEQKTERKPRKTPEQVSASVADALAPAPAPEPETDTRPISRKDLTDFAMSLSRQDTSFGAKIKATLVKHGSPTISTLAEDKIGVVFAELNSLAQALAREPGEEG